MHAMLLNVMPRLTPRITEFEIRINPLTAKNEVTKLKATKKKDEC